MKQIVLLSLSLVSVQNMLCMEEEDSHPRTNPLQNWREQQHSESSEYQPGNLELLTFRPGDRLATGEFVALDLEEATRLPNKPTIEDWKTQLENSIRKGKSAQLIQLLSENGQPAEQRGFHFIPYQNALEQIRSHKDKEVRILTNTAEPDAKCFKCCNTTHIWNRWVAPGVIVTAKLAQIGFAGWAIARAVNLSLVQSPANYYEAASKAAPAIGALVAAFGDLPFSVINAWRRRILKTQQAKYEYYLLAEHSVQTQENIEKIVLQNQGGIQALLARGNSHPSQTRQEQHHDSNARDAHQDGQLHALDDIDAQFGDGILLETRK